MRCGFAKPLSCLLPSPPSLLPRDLERGLGLGLLLLALPLPLLLRAFLAGCSSPSSSLLRPATSPAGKTCAHTNHQM
jgi:hypothetical protein